MRKIYTNEFHEICDLDNTERTDLTEHVVDELVLGNWSDAVLLYYKYEEVPDGGYSFYPFVDTSVILGIERMSENIKNLKDENVSLKEANENLEMAVVEIFEKVVVENQELKERSENAELALAEIYEVLIGG